MIRIVLENHKPYSGAPDGVRRPNLPRPSVVATIATAAFIVLANPAGSLADSAEIPIPMDEREMRFAGITTTLPDKEQREIELSFPGTVVIPPQQLRVVAAPANGLIESLQAVTDEPVRAGQPVAQLRSTELVEAQRHYLAALADETLASDRLRRLQVLFEARATPERELRAAEAAAINAKAHLDERRQILALMELSESDIETLRATRKIFPAITVHAPASGTIIKRHANVGERLDAAAPIYTIAKLEPLWINIQVPAARLSALNTGETVVIPAQGAKGRIIRVARTVDAQTQSATAVAEIDVNGGSVRPGLVTTAVIRLSQGPGTQWSIPAAAVVRHRDRTWVFVRSKDGFVARSVQVVAESPARTSIRAELRPDDQIADRGIIALLSELAVADKG